MLKCFLALIHYMYCTSSIAYAYGYGELGEGILCACLETAKTLSKQVSAILNCEINIIISGFTLHWILLDLLMMLVVHE